VNGRILRFAALILMVAPLALLAVEYGAMNANNAPAKKVSENEETAGPEDAAAQLKYLLKDLSAPLSVHVVGGKVIIEGTIKTQADKLRFDQVIELFPDAINMVRIEAEQVLIDVGVTLVEVEASNGHDISILDPDRISDGESFSFDWARRSDNYEPSRSIEWSVAASGQLLKSLRAMVDNGQAKIVARPRIVTEDGEAASLLAGGQIPYISSGVGYANTEYKDYGVKLDVTPDLLATGEVEMDLNIEVSRPTSIYPATRGNPGTIGLDTRRTHLKVAVEKGKSLILAGLSDITSERDMKWGFLFPLFASSREVKRRELLVVVTPNAPSVLGYNDFNMIDKKDVDR
jgi:pilus assembly protein CpaC